MNLNASVVEAGHKHSKTKNTTALYRYSLITRTRVLVLPFLCLYKVHKRYFEHQIYTKVKKMKTKLHNNY